MEIVVLIWGILAVLAVRFIYGSYYGNKPLSNVGGTMYQESKNNAHTGLKNV